MYRLAEGQACWSLKSRCCMRGICSKPFVGSSRSTGRTFEVCKASDICTQLCEFLRRRKEAVVVHEAPRPHVLCKPLVALNECVVRPRPVVRPNVADLTIEFARIKFLERCLNGLRRRLVPSSCKHMPTSPGASHGEVEKQKRALYFVQARRQCTIWEDLHLCQKAAGGHASFHLDACVRKAFAWVTSNDAL